MRAIDIPAIRKRTEDTRKQYGFRWNQILHDRTDLLARVDQLQAALKALRAYTRKLTMARIPGNVTHTYALLEVSAACYDEIKEQLKVAGYDPAFGDAGEIDMHGIALTREALPTLLQEMAAETD